MDSINLMMSKLFLIVRYKFGYMVPNTSHASSRSSTRSHSQNSCYGTPQDLFWTGTEDMTLEATLHNMDRPAEGEIFESNQLGEIADI